jgi:hypothetical protein
MTAPTIEKDAGAEALFWTVHVRDEFQSREELHRVLYHYIRLKVFDEKGKEKVATIDIEYGPHTGIDNIAARTIKADGSIVEMKGNAVYKRDLVRAGGRKIQLSIATGRSAPIRISFTPGCSSSGNIPYTR